MSITAINAFSRHLLCRNCQNCVLIWLFSTFQPLCFQNHSSHFFHQGLNEQFLLCGKLREKYFALYPPRIGTLKGQKLAKKNLFVAFFFSETPFLSKTTACISCVKIPIGASYTQRVVEKYTTRFINCSGPLMNG